MTNIYNYINNIVPEDFILEGRAQQFKTSIHNLFSAAKGMMNRGIKIDEKALNFFKSLQSKLNTKTVNDTIIKKLGPAIASAGQSLNTSISNLKTIDPKVRETADRAMILISKGLSNLPR